MIDWTVHHVHSNLSYFIYFHNSSISCCTATAVFSTTNNSLKQGDKSLQPHQLLRSLQKQSVLEKCRKYECDITLYCMLGQWLNFVMKSSCYLTHYRFTAYLCFVWLKSLLILSKSKPVSKKAEAKHRVCTVTTPQGIWWSTFDANDLGFDGILGVSWHAENEPHLHSCHLPFCAFVKIKAKHR